MSAFKSVVAGAGVLLAVGDVLQGITGGARFSDQVVKPAMYVGLTT